LASTVTNSSTTTTASAYGYCNWSINKIFKSFNVASTPTTTATNNVIQVRGAIELPL
jgi:hypothetical protein